MASRGKLSLIFGLVGLVLLICWYTIQYILLGSSSSFFRWLGIILFFGLPVAVLVLIILAIVFGAISIKKKKKDKAKGIIGLILGIITFIGSLYMWLMFYILIFVGI